METLGGDGEGRVGGRLLLRPLLQKVRGGLAVRLRIDGSLCTVVRVVVDVLNVGQRSWFGHFVESGSLCLHGYMQRTNVELEKIFSRGAEFGPSST